MTRIAVFRAEAGPGVGAGHAMRCLALADALAARGWRCVLLTASTDWPIPNWSRAGHEVLAFDAAAGSDDDARRTAATLAERRAALLVLDDYRFGPGHAAASRSPAREPVLRFDDLGTDVGSADLVLNGNAGAEVRYAAAYPEGVDTMLGTAHFLLRREVAAAERRPVPGRVAVTLGGAVELSALLRIVTALTACAAVRGVDCVAPLDAAARRAVEALPGGRARAPDALPEALAGASVVVCAAGVTALEAASLGAPAVLVTLADNQVPGGRAIDAAGAALLLGDLAQVQGKIPAAVAALLHDDARLAAMAACGRALVDGRGAKRVVDRIEQALQRRERGEKGCSH